MAEKKKAAPAVKKAPAKKAPAKKAPAKRKASAEIAEVLPKARTFAENIKYNKDDILASLKRTLIPLGIGAVSASFIGPYVDVNVLRDLLSALIAAVYYTVVRVVEVQNPKAGLLLGSATPPKYEK